MKTTPKTSSKNQPKQYQQGWVEFYKLKFLVTPDVLIPRPETELLVDEVLKFVKDSHVASAPRNDPSNTRVLLRNDVIAIPTTSREKQSFTILDLGTGSGNIAISIAKHLPTPGVGTRIIATDVSEKALNIAKQNAKLHHVEDKIIFVHSNLKDRLPRSPRRPRNDGNIDIIVANLPYIPTSRISHLDSSVKDFEPWVALDGGEDGFDLYRKLFQQITKFSLTPRRCKPKLIIGEIDYTHGEIAVSEAQKYFPEAKVEVKTDLAHKQRILSIKFF